MLIKTEGIIIRSKDYGEGNKIITIYSSQMGKISVMARGAKKTKSRLSSVSQLFTYGSFLIQKGSGHSLGTLSQGEIVQSFRELRHNLTLTAYAAYFAELLDKLVEDNERSTSLFNLLLTIFTYLEEEKDAEILARLYEMKMLMASGYRPVVLNCVNCACPEPLQHFSIREGGLLCRQCAT
nr:DNA repair protein RecO [Caldalkalibacillus mannanilyticus]